MLKLCRFLVLLIVITAPMTVYADSVESTRIIDPKQHVCSEGGGYPYRSKAAYVLKELDIKTGDIVVDIGAGDGWWADKMAEFVGSSGTIHASEVNQKQVDKMKKRFTEVPQVRPYLCPLDSTGLDENTCDLAFLSKTYHHFAEGSHVDYLKHLHQAVKPTGRLCIIEKHIVLAKGRSREHAWSPALLVQQAEEAGWIIVRLEMLTGTHHFIALFVQKELFLPKSTVNTKEQIDLSLNDKLIEEMKSYFGDKQGLIDHTMAVYGYANQLHRTEGGDLLVVKAGAIYHDIGIPEAKRVHGSSAGKYQEIEGPPIARKILNKLGVAPESIDHICRIIANHHTAHDESTVNTIEFQIVWDADGLVNHARRKLGSNNEEISKKIEQLFRTPTGKKMAKEMFTKN